jgi:hypothetical protein
MLTAYNSACRGCLQRLCRYVFAGDSLDRNMVKHICHGPHTEKLQWGANYHACHFPMNNVTLLNFWIAGLIEDGVPSTRVPTEFQWSMLSNENMWDPPPPPPPPPHTHIHHTHTHIHTPSHARMRCSHTSMLPCAHADTHPHTAVELWYIVNM